MSQEKRILKYLQRGKSLTPLGALRLFDCLRLGARIYDLRMLGYKIITKMRKVPSGKYVATYRLGS